MKTTILQLEAHDDVISTRDKMTWSKTPRILLVWPRRGKILNRKMDLVLLQRQGEQLGAQIAFVTRDPQVIPYAREVGIPVFANTRQAQRRPWGPAPVTGLLAAREHKPLDPAGLRRQREGLRSIPNPIWQYAWVRLGVFLVGVISVLALALFFYPTGQVNFSPARVDQRLRLPLRASADIQSASATGDLPASWIEVEVEASRESPTTGMISAPDGYARGSARFTNLTTQAVRVPAGLVVRTLSDPPSRFAVVDTVEVPAGVGQNVEAAVRALQAGSESNVPVGSIVAMDGDLGLRLTVTNPDVLQGGTERLARAPSTADVTQARDVLLQDLQGMALAELSTRLAPGQELLQESLQVVTVLTEETRPEPGQAADLFTLQMQVAYRAMAVKTADVEQVARAGLDANLPGGFHAVDGSMRIQPEGTPSLDVDGAVFQWPVRVERQVEADWSEESVVQAVLGRSPSDAVHSLQQRVFLEGEPQIRIAPEWWRRMPFLPFRITVVAQ